MRKCLQNVGFFPKNRPSTASPRLASPRWRLPRYVSEYLILSSSKCNAVQNSHWKCTAIQDSGLGTPGKTFNSKASHMKSSTSATSIPVFAGAVEVSCSGSLSLHGACISAGEFYTYFVLDIWRSICKFNLVFEPFIDYILWLLF